MIIKKFLHSCILLEQDGKRLLFDPGTFCFIEKQITPKDIGRVDCLILTHSHPDHFFPEAIKELIALGAATIIANQDISDALKEEKIHCQIIHHGETFEVAGFTIEAFEAPHGRLPVPCPHNLTFRINKRFVHPGDSFTIAGLKSCDVLALPIAGPWATIVDGLECADLLRPKIVIPIHDAIIKDFMLKRMYTLLCEPYLKERGIEFRPLNIGEEIEI